MNVVWNSIRMADKYKFKLRRLETHDEELHPYILGILEWQIPEYITPASLRYFKKPEKSDYPLNLETENYNFRKLIDKKDILPIFLSKENIRDELKLRQLKKISIWSNRATLAMILMGAFYRYDWCIFATKVGSNIYLSAKAYVSTSKESKYHWKFVQNCFAESVHDKPNTNLSIDEDDQFYCLFHAEIGDFDLIYTGQMIGVLAETDVKNMYDLNEINQLNVVMTKTMYEQPPHDWLHQYKYWWTQAHLSKVKDIFVGIKRRGEGGPVLVNEEIRHLKVDQLCQAAKWKKERQLGELHGFLKWLQTKMSDIDCPYTTCELNFKMLSKDVTFKVHQGKTEYSFLSEDLIDYAKTNE